MTTLFFDLGGVLIDFNLEKMYFNIAELCKCDVELIKHYFFEKELGEMYSRGVIDSQTLYQFFVEMSGGTFSYEQLMEAASNIFKEKREMTPLLEKLKQQKCRLYLVSNTCEAHIEYIKTHFPLLQFFDGLILSYEVVSQKPEPAIFQAALEKAEVKPSDVLFIDDIASHVEQARKMGMEAHHFHGKATLLEALHKRGVDV